MRIGFDVSPTVHRHAGLGRYAHELLSALTRIDPQDQYTAFHNRAAPGEFMPPPLDRLPRRVIPLSAKPWRMSVLLADWFHVPMDRWIPGLDLFHGTDHLLPTFRRSATVFTLHDLIFHFFPEYHLPLNRAFLSLMLPRFLRRADAIIAVSECTRRDAVQIYNIPPDKISVIYEGVNPNLHPVHEADLIQRARARYAQNGPFIFTLGTIEPRKNIPALIDALRIVRRRGFPHRLVIAGRKGWLYQSVFDHVKQTGMQDAIDFTDYVPDSDLPALYAACDAFVFPSLYEGFGLPPLEAMACGAPVVCSNTSSLVEVVGDAALPVNPRDVGEMAHAIERVITDDIVRNELRAMGTAQAAKFSWERAARETLAVYEKVVAGRALPPGK